MAAVTRRKSARDDFLAAKVGEKPEKQGQSKTEKEAGHDWEIEGSVFAAMDDIAGESAETEGEFSAEIKECANKDQ